MNAADTPRPIGYWTVEDNDLRRELLDQIRDVLPKAAEEGKEIVVVEGVTLRWTPAAITRCTCECATK